MSNETTRADIAREWFFRAQTDYESAVILEATRHPAQIDSVCYHCQQSVEKALKSYIAASGEAPPKTHDLNSLLEVCEKYSADFSKYERICSNMTLYATNTRYPGHDRVTADDMRFAMRHTKDIIEFTADKLIDSGISPPKYTEHKKAVEQGISGGAEPETDRPF